MCPCLTMNNIINSLKTYIKHFCNFSLGITLKNQFANLHNLYLNKFSATVFGSFCSSMLSCILSITKWRVPSKIDKIIVSRFPVIMTSLHTKRTRTNKGKKNQSMDSHIPTSTIFTQAYYKITFFIGPWFTYFLDRICYNSTLPFPCTSPKRPYSTVITNFITWIIRNWFPNLLGYVKLRISHGRNPLGGSVMIEPMWRHIHFGSLIYNIYKL